MNDFLRKTKAVVSKAVDVAGENFDKAKDFIGDKAEPVKIEIELVKLNNELAEKLYEFGELHYYDADNEEEIRGCKDAIFEIEAAIEQLKAQRQRLRKEASQTVSKTVVYCTNCGASHKDSEKFCSKCGEKLKK